MSLAYIRRTSHAHTCKRFIFELPPRFSHNIMTMSLTASLSARSKEQNMFSIKNTFSTLRSCSQLCLKFIRSTHSSRNLIFIKKHQENIFLREIEFLKVQTRQFRCCLKNVFAIYLFSQLLSLFIVHKYMWMMKMFNDINWQQKRARSARKKIYIRQEKKKKKCNWTWLVTGNKLFN